MWPILSTLVSSLWHFLWIICLSSQLEMMTRTNFHPSTRMLHQLQLGPQNQKIAPLQLLQGFQLVQWCFPLPIYLAMHLHCKIHLQLSLPLFPLFSWSVIWSRTSCKDSFFAIALTRTEWQARWCEAFICSLSVLKHLFVNFRLLCENMKASKPNAIMFCLEYVMKENRRKTRQFERVCVKAWVYIHSHTHRSKAFMFVSTTCSWTLVVSLTFILPHELSMAGHFWQVWLCAILYKIKAFKRKLPD